MRREAIIWIAFRVVAPCSRLLVALGCTIWGGYQNAQIGNRGVRRRVGRLRVELIRDRAAVNIILIVLAVIAGLIVLLVVSLMYAGALVQKYLDQDKRKP
jgi:hypothetical protein